MRLSTVRVIIFAVFMNGCLGVPGGVSPVEDFNLERYLGKWYEIARLNHPFERGLSDVSAEYSLRDDGGVRVINRGFSISENQWKEAEGKAYRVEGEHVGYLKVSFFGPFYGSYIVFELDQDNYQYAFVTGNSKSYLWLLARTPTISQGLKERFIQRSRELGYHTDNLIWVKHTRADP